ncbi:complex I subunit 5 family protein [Natranaerofaba carboxydovora]|uniref:complex I subunit 5 family protein n=1 Tax=Natranaerofaba carboxydovora TaxID=2742683 RepID=UPI001F12BE6C|nr:complex I subunit 5 family protein [Natranaerofaba carboxydovora]UMZ74591.1 Hydrogenase-4 component B [Natranaerofaba carboxydovora]
MYEPDTIIQMPWPFLAVIIPLIGGLIILVKRNISITVMNTMLFVFSFLPLLFTILMFNTITKTKVYYFSMDIVSPFNLTFQVDGLGFLIALVSAFVWFSATVYSFSYMEKYKDKSRFYGYLLLTLSGTIGVALAGDFLTLLLFFEIMTLASYVLVVHSQSEEAYDAGNIYLYMGIFGGLSVFAGCGLLYYLSGSVDFVEASQGLIEVGEPGLRYLVVILFSIGFGIKAGMMPVHIWLPKAHPVAPAPASALLSGIMIKAGAYGIIRTLSLFAPPGGIDIESLGVLSPDIIWQYFSNMGYVLIWIGVVTMFMGVSIALLQGNAKRMLACHSISQMGYILMGIGAAAYLGNEGGMGLSGSIYHIINHALFKSLLFLSVGMVYLKTKEVNMYNLGGLWRNLPFTALFCLIAALGIAGFPGLNGYASKTLLHHAIEDSAIYGAHYTSLMTAEKIFVVTSCGTVASFIKLMHMTFFGKRPDDLKEVKGESLAAKLSMGFLALSIIALGVFPHAFIGKVLVPTLSYFNMEADHLEYLADTNVFIAPDLINILIAFAGGTAIYITGKKTGLFKKKLPEWLGSEFYFGKFNKFSDSAWTVAITALEAILRPIKTLAQKIYSFGFNSLMKLDYRPGDANTYQTISFANLDFDLLIVIIMLSAVLSLAFYIQFFI